MDKNQAQQLKDFYEAGVPESKAYKMVAGTTFHGSREFFKTLGPRSKLMRSAALEQNEVESKFKKKIILLKCNFS